MDRRPSEADPSTSSAPPMAEAGLAASSSPVRLGRNAAPLSLTVSAIEGAECNRSTVSWRPVADGLPFAVRSSLTDTVRDVIHRFNKIGLACLDPQRAGGRPHEEQNGAVLHPDQRPLGQRDRGALWTAAAASLANSRALIASAMASNPATLPEVTDATGIPLAATLTGGNRNDVTQLIPLFQAVPPVRGKRGRPRRRSDVVLADRRYDHEKYRRLVWDLGVKPLIARRGTEYGSGPGTQRWVVQRAFAHLHWFRRLRIRWEIRYDIHEAFLTLGCAHICRRRLMDHRL